MRRTYKSKTKSIVLKMELKCLKFNQKVSWDGTDKVKIRIMKKKNQLIGQIILIMSILQVYCLMMMDIIILMFKLKFLLI